MTTEELEYACNLLYIKFQNILDFSDNEWIGIFEKFEELLKEDLKHLEIY